MNEHENNGNLSESQNQEKKRGRGRPLGYRKPDHLRHDAKVIRVPMELVPAVELMIKTFREKR